MYIKVVDELYDKRTIKEVICVYEAGQGKMNGCRKRKKEVKREKLLQPNHGYYLYHQHGKIDRKQMQKEGVLHGFSLRS